MPRGHLLTNCVSLWACWEVPRCCFPMITLPSCTLPTIRVSGWSSDESAVIHLSARCGQPGTIKLLLYGRGGPHLLTSTWPRTQQLRPVGDQRTHTRYTTHMNTMKHKQNNRNIQSNVRWNNKQTFLRASSSVWPLRFTSLGAAAVQSTYTGLDGAHWGNCGPTARPGQGVESHPVERVQGRGGQPDLAGRTLLCYMDTEACTGRRGLPGGPHRG